MKTFKFINKLANVRRWSHAYCHKEESVLEHTAVVAIIALGIGAEVGADIGPLLERALLHDMEEVITGDIPNPTKYHNPKITEQIKNFEEVAALEVATEFFDTWAYGCWASSKDKSLEGEIIKIADVAAVVYKIRQETALGNQSFKAFEENVWNALLQIKQNLKNECLIPYVHDLMDTTLGANNEST